MALAQAFVPRNTSTNKAPSTYVSLATAIAYCVMDQTSTTVLFVPQIAATFKGNVLMPAHHSYILKTSLTLPT